MWVLIKTVRPSQSPPLFDRPVLTILSRLAIQAVFTAPSSTTGPGLRIALKPLLFFRNLYKETTAMRRALIAMIAGFVVVAGTEAQAQTCRGTVAIAHSARGILGAGTAFSKTADAYGVSAGGGSTGWFASGGFQGLHYSDLGAKTWALTGVSGAQFTEPGNYFAVCPMGIVSYERTTKLIALDGVTGYTLTTMGGVSAGATAFQSTMFQIVPTGGFFIASDNARVSNAEEGTSARETYGLFQFGVGVMIGVRSSITPMWIVPINKDGGENSFAISYSFSFGRR